jgi:hypothetical protein
MVAMNDDIRVLVKDTLALSGHTQTDLAKLSLSKRSKEVTETAVVSERVRISRMLNGTTYELPEPYQAWLELYGLELMVVPKEFKDQHEVEVTNQILNIARKSRK